MVSPKSAVQAATHICPERAGMGQPNLQPRWKWVALAVGFALLVPMTARAQSITSREENGRKVYVNDEVPRVMVHGRAVPSVRVVRYVYWSNKEHRWKPVPSVSPYVLKEARSAAAEVKDFVSSQPSGASRDSSTDPNYKRLARGRVVSSAAIDQAIEEAATKHNVDPNLVRALVKVESNFNPSAVSRKGAMGLMQLMPATARELNVTNPFDPEQNVDAGVRHLKHLLENFNGDVGLSLAAYNAGQGAVQRSGGVPPFAETRNYVRRITSLYGKGDLATQWSGPIRAPIHVTRDERGVLTFTNTE